MAKMIPNYCWTQSPGEKEIFDILKNSPDTQDWTVLHSLHIARHVSKAKGEADFVILIPKRGIFVLEIKSHNHISVKNGSWHLGNSDEISNSPFVQSETAMFSIRRNLNEELPFTRSVTFLNACWFTAVEFPKETKFEWQAWQVLNETDKKTAPQSILNSFAAGVEHLQKSVSSTIRLENNFGLQEIEAITQELRPNFEFTLSEKVIRANRREQLINFATEQFGCLDLFSENPRVVFKGPAGTGKSILAVEMASRLASQNKRVLLICFNKNLVDYLKSQLKGPMAEVRTIDSILLEQARKVRKDLPSNPIEALRNFDYSTISVNEEDKFDALVIDEAQDVLVGQYVAFLDSLIRGGLSKGNWYAFGDFDAQRIYSMDDNLKILREIASDFTLGKLSKNCRNVVQIGSFAEGVLPNIPKWDSFMRIGENPEPVLEIIKENQDMVPYLDGAIEKLRSEYFSNDDIIVLSPTEISSPGQVFAHSKFAQKYVEFSGKQSGKISFSTISRFKGLESPCVIALDIDQMSNWTNRNELLYILLTRATDRLTILANLKARALLIQTLKKEGHGNDR